jgi:hypothetical protein
MNLRFVLPALLALVVLAHAAPLPGATEGDQPRLARGRGRLHLTASKRGAIRPGRARRFRFAVVFRASAPNSLQGRRASASFAWRAVQRS